MKPYLPEAVDKVYPFFDKQNPDADPVDRAEVMVQSYVMGMASEMATAITEWHKGKRSIPPKDRVELLLVELSANLGGLMAGKKSEEVFEERPTNFDEGSIYVIRAGNSLCKIGKATDIDQRLRAIQTGNHEAVELVLSQHTRWFGLVEKTLHRHFASKHIRGEWYDLDNSDIAAIPSLMEREQKDIARHRPHDYPDCAPA